jgi:hypothetical protein
LNKVFAFLGFLLSCHPAIARPDSKACKPVGTQCVGIIAKDNGRLWIADRAFQDGQYIWVPIKEADCPSEQGKHGLTYYSHDPVYGDYECSYDRINQRNEYEPVAGVRESSIGRYMRTHKVLLAVDTALVLSSLADAASTVHCMHTNPFCREENPLLSPHPSNLQVYGLKLGLTAAFIGWTHYWVHTSRRRGWGESYYGAWAAPLIVFSALATKHNVSIAEEYSAPRAAARARLLGDAPKSKDSLR